MASSPALQILDHEPEAFSFNAWHNVTIIVWRRQATGPIVERLSRATESMVSGHPEGFSNIHLVLGGAGMPTSEARSGFTEITNRYSDHIAAAAVVLLGGGFWNSALRSAITGVLMLTPRSFPVRIHNTIDEVVGWLPDEHLRRTKVRLSPAELAAALQAAQG